MQRQRTNEHDTESYRVSWISRPVIEASRTDVDRFAEGCGSVVPGAFKANLSAYPRFGLALGFARMPTVVPAQDQAGSKILQPESRVRSLRSFKPLPRLRDTNSNKV
jgi:hypothetical protein